MRPKVPTNPTAMGRHHFGTLSFTKFENIIFTLCLVSKALRHLIGNFTHLDEAQLVGKYTRITFEMASSNHIAKKIII